MSIVHLTDLHLCLESDGGSLTVEKRSLIAGVLHSARVPYGLIAGHDPDAWASLKANLEPIIEEELEESGGAPLMVAQTGDVEALGGTGEVTGDPYEQFTGYKALHRLRDEVAGALAEGSLGPLCWVDVYGNHDAWGVPATVPSRSVMAALALLDGMAGTWPELCHQELRCAPGVDVFRINSVVPGAAGLLAFGRVGSHLPGMSVEQAIQALSTSVAPTEGHRAVRVLLLHHPPHFFDAQPVLSRIPYVAGRLPGVLQGADQLALVATEHGIQLVMAGHRHRYDPPLDQANLGGGGQDPLGAGSVQFAAASPTKWHRRASEFDYSFPIYRLLESGDGTLEVHRKVWRYQPNAGGLTTGSYRPPRRQPGWTRLFSGLPIS